MGGVEINPGPGPGPDPDPGVPVTGNIVYCWFW